MTVLILVSFLLGCSESFVVYLPQYSEETVLVPPPEILIGEIPDSSSASPSFEFPDNSQGNYEYQVRIVDQVSGSVVVDWQAIESGQSIDGLSLSDSKSYYAEFRVVDSEGNVSLVVTSEAWIPGSDGCVGDKINNTPYAGGAGTFDDPFLICTSDQLTAISSNYSDFKSSFSLLANIDLSGQTFDGIGNSDYPFTGRFLGKNKEIRNMQLSRASGDYLGFFNYSLGAYVSNIDFVSPTVSASASDNVAILSGYCQYSFFKNVSITNLSLEGNNYVGSACGYTWDVSILNFSATGEITGGNSIIGGIIGEADRGHYININSQIDISSANASSVGGLVGADGWSNPEFQNVRVESNIVGSTGVGGIIGENWDGSSFYRSSFEGDVIGLSSVGGIVGESYDVPFRLYMLSVEANITGNSQVGGFAGVNGEGAIYYDSYVKATLNGVGDNQTDFGGFWGYVNYHGSINSSYADVDIVTSGQKVGGAVGYIDYFNAANDIYDSFVVADIQGTSASNNLGFFVAQNDDVALAASNSFYWSGGTCTNSGTGNCNTPAASGVANVSSFHSSSNAPLSSWNFSEIWQTQAGAFPTLNQQQYVAPTLSQSCDVFSIVNVTYDCAITITDTDVHEIQMIELMDDNSCHWINAYEGSRLFGNPNIEDVGLCNLVFRATDGSNNSDLVSIEINVLGGVSMEPNQGLSSHIDLGQQSTAAGAKLFTYTLTNNEETQVQGINVTGVFTAHYQFEGGGSFPGSSGTCDGDLDPGESCTWVLSFDPTTTGFHYLDLQIEFEVDSTSHSFPQRFRGWGVTPSS